MKSSGAAFRSKLAGALHDLGCRPTYADPDVWLNVTRWCCAMLTT
jgi:hypothetical protein